MKRRPSFDLTASAVPQPRIEAGPSWHEMSQQKRGRFRRGLSLRGRMLLYFTLLVFGSVGASTWMLTLRNQGVAALSLTQMSTAIAHAVAASASGRTTDSAALQTIAEAQIGGDQVLAVAFIDAAGKTIASAGREGVDATRLRSDTAATMKVASVEGDLLVCSAPVAGDRGVETSPARAVIVTSTRSIGRSMRATLELIALVGSGVTLTAALLSSVLLSRSKRPLRDLVTSVRGVIAGEAESLKEIRDNEQVAEIAVAFNELIANLRTNRAQLAAANDELAALIKRLEQNVADRTSQLEAANERLSGEIAEKEDFLRAVSHDLNAPLRNIGGMVSMLMLKNKDTLPADVVSRLERIRKNVDVETDLINELLELSRIKTRRQTLELVDIESVVWELRGTFENDLKTKHIEVILETSLPPIYAERARVRQVFQNLIDNAIKYMGEGQVREIRIGCRVSVTEAAFYVRDTGLGIHPEDLDKVFFVFRRGRGEASQKVAGKGVGLASVKSIIETYAGHIRVESTLGEGAAFHFTINGKYVPSVAGAPPVEMGSQPSQPTPTLASPTVALTDVSENRAA